MKKLKKIKVNKVLMVFECIHQNQENDSTMRSTLHTHEKKIQTGRIKKPRANFENEHHLRYQTHKMCIVQNPIQIYKIKKYSSIFSNSQHACKEFWQLCTHQNNITNFERIEGWNIFQGLICTISCVANTHLILKQQKKITIELHVQCFVC